jgi:hypothetical protein
VDNPTAPRLDALAWVRPMNPNAESGGSQPHVFDTETGPYLVKAKNNPQGLRVLPNELVVGLCLDWLGVSHPRPAIVDVPADVIAASPGAKFDDGTALASGKAFGSELTQSDPQATVDPSLLANVSDLAGTVALDTWIRNEDGRQYRVRPSADVPNRYDLSRSIRGTRSAQTGTLPPSTTRRHRRHRTPRGRSTVMTCSRTSTDSKLSARRTPRQSSTRSRTTGA